MHFAGLSPPSSPQYVRRVPRAAAAEPHSIHRRTVGHIRSRCRHPDPSIPHPRTAPHRSPRRRRTERHTISPSDTYSGQAPSPERGSHRSRQTPRSQKPPLHNAPSVSTILVTDTLYGSACTPRTTGLPSSLACLFRAMTRQAGPAEGTIIAGLTWEYGFIILEPKRTIHRCANP